MPTGSAGYAHNQAGGRGGQTNNGGLFFELEQVEAKDGTYPATEGFCCLVQVRAAFAYRPFSWSPSACYGYSVGIAEDGDSPRTASFGLCAGSNVVIASRG